MLTPPPAPTQAPIHAARPAVPKCRICGCTDDNCWQCYEATGHPCWWVEPDLCSACAADAILHQLADTIARDLRNYTFIACSRDHLASRIHMHLANAISGAGVPPAADGNDAQEHADAS